MCSKSVARELCTRMLSSEESRRVLARANDAGTRCYNQCVTAHAAIFAAFFLIGEWLSLVEHLVRDQGVGGSNPLSPTIFNNLADHLVFSSQM